MQRMKVVTNNNGRAQVTMRTNGMSRTMNVARLVLTHFVGPCPPKMEACHFPDRNPFNNNVNNLRWDTRKANAHDAIIHDTLMRGERNHKARLTDALVLELREDHRNGRSLGYLSKKYRVAKSTVARIVKRRMWKHLP